jgi:arabinogalactan oligomer/maltooligosaccharide transport system substrate-binding protein
MQDVGPRPAGHDRGSRTLITHLPRRLFIVAALALVVSSCSNGVAVTSTTTLATTTTEATTTTTTLPVSTTTTTTTTPPEVVRVWADEAVAATITALAESFTADTGVVIEVETQDFISIRNLVLRALDDQSEPDLFVGAHAWTGELLESGAIKPLRGLTAEQAAAFVDPALMGFTIDGARYAVPYAMETITLWTNTTAAGTEIPATLDEVLDICDDLPEENTCIVAAGGAGEPDAFYHFPFLSAFGASLFRYEDAVGYHVDEPGVDSAAAVAGATLIADLSRGNYLPPLDYPTAKERFEEGTAAFWLTGAWEEADIATAAEVRGFDYTAIKMPQIEGGVSRPFVEAQGVFLSAGAAPPAESFLLEVLASEDGQRRLAAAAGRLPTHEAIAAQIVDPVHRAFADTAALGIPTPNVAGMTEDVWEAWGRALTEIRDRRAEPQLALEEAARQIRVLMGIPAPTPSTTPPE